MAGIAPVSGVVVVQGEVAAAAGADAGGGAAAIRQVAAAESQVEARSIGSVGGGAATTLAERLSRGDICEPALTEREIRDIEAQLNDSERLRRGWRPRHARQGTPASQIIRSLTTAADWARQNGLDARQIFGIKASLLELLLSIERCEFIDGSFSSVSNAASGVYLNLYQQALRDKYSCSDAQRLCMEIYLAISALSDNQLGLVWVRPSFVQMSIESIPRVYEIVKSYCQDRPVPMDVLVGCIAGFREAFGLGILGMRRLGATNENAVRYARESGLCYLYDCYSRILNDRAHIDQYGEHTSKNVALAFRRGFIWAQDMSHFDSCERQLSNRLERKFERERIMVRAEGPKFEATIYVAQAFAEMFRQVIDVLSAPGSKSYGRLVWDQDCNPILESLEQSLAFMYQIKHPYICYLVDVATDAYVAAFKDSFMSNYNNEIERPCYGEIMKRALERGSQGVGRVVADIYPRISEEICAIGAGMDLSCISLLAWMYAEEFRASLGNGTPEQFHAACEAGKNSAIKMKECYARLPVGIADVITRHLLTVINSNHVGRKRLNAQGVSDLFSALLEAVGRMAGASINQIEEAVRATTDCYVAAQEACRRGLAIHLDRFFSVFRRGMVSEQSGPSGAAICECWKFNARVLADAYRLSHLDVAARAPDLLQYTTECFSKAYALQVEGLPVDETQLQEVNLVSARIAGEMFLRVARNAALECYVDYAEAMMITPVEAAALAGRRVKEEYVRLCRTGHTHEMAIAQAPAAVAGR